MWSAKKPRHLRSYSTRRKMTMIYCKRRVSSFADSLKSLYAMSSCPLQIETNGFLNWLKKVFSSCRIHLRATEEQRTTASLPLPLCQTHSDQNFQTHHLLPSLTTESTRNLSVRAMPSVSGPTRLGGTGWFNYKALDEPYKAHFARTCIRPEVNRLLCSA